MIKGLKDFSVYTSVSVITGSISFLLLPILTTYLSPDDYGVLSIFNASVRFLSAFIGLGMAHVLMVDLIKNRKKFTERVSSFFIITCVISLLVCFFTLIYVYFSNSFFGIPVSIALTLPIIALFLVFFEFVLSIMVYLKNAKQFAYFSFGKFGVETSFTLLFVVAIGMDWKGRVASMVIALVLFTTLSLRYLFRHFNLAIKVQFVKKQVLKLFSEGSALFFMTISFMIINLSDRFFIEYFKGAAETGIYGVASTIASTMFLVIGALMKIIRPKIYELLSIKDPNRNKHNLGFTFHIALIAIAVLFSLFIPFIFEYFIGTEFKAAEQLCYYLVIGIVFFGSYQYFISFILYSKQHKINTAIAVSCIIINLILNYFLIKIYGGLGAAYSTAFTYFLMFFLSIGFHLKDKIS